MKNKLIILIASVLFVICLVTKINSNKKGCTLPPKDFTESDLVGTWKAHRLDDTDTLIIREDGYYKQKIHQESKGFDYESDWQRWWVKYSDSGIPYLHLEGMRFCLQWTEMDCEHPDYWGGGRNYCEGEGPRSPFHSTIKAGVLMVLGIPKSWNQPPGGVKLWSFEVIRYDIIVYALQEP